MSAVTVAVAGDREERRVDHICGELRPAAEVGDRRRHTGVEHVGGHTLALPIGSEVVRLAQRQCPLIDAVQAPGSRVLVFCRRHAVGDLHVPDLLDPRDLGTMLQRGQLA